jgi:3-oxoacyl-[acyl-carrier-protein] synthase II
MQQDVVVTGIGLVAGSFIYPEALFDHIGRGGSLIQVHPFHAACGFPNPASAFLDPVTWRVVDKYTFLESAETLGPAARLAWYTAGQAWEQSGLPPRLDQRRGGVFIACNKHPMEAERLTGLANCYDFEKGQLDLDRYIATSKHEPERFYRRLQDNTALTLAQRFGLMDAIMTHGDACAAGGMSIGNAYRYIRHGVLDVALAGGTEVMCNLVPLIAFSVIGAHAQESSFTGPSISRPFDKDRGGFVMGEGSACLVLESRSHAEARGANILARISGYAGVAEACSMTASKKDGSEYARCIESALSDAGLEPTAVDHINAHGTSTLISDACEAAAVRRVFGAHAGHIPITANKSAMGHSLGNSGATEAVLSVLSLQRQLVLPTLNYSEADVACDGLDIVTDLRPTSVRVVLSNSFGFGGENCALILQAA